MSGTAHRVDLQHTRSKKGWDLQEYNASGAFERPAKSLSLEGKAVKEQLCQKTKTVLMHSECCLLLGTFSSIIFPLLSAADPGFSAFISVS